MNMTTLFRYISIFMVSVTSLTACDDAPEFDPPVPVIEGWIDSDGYPNVIFTSSLIPDGKDCSLADKMIRWGRIEISDGFDTVVLTGRPDKRYFPPYRYDTFQMKGGPGRTYTIRADYRDFHATATCRMPEPTNIDSISVERIAGNDTLRAATVHFTAPDDVPAYFCLFISTVSRADDADRPDISRPLPSMLGTAEVTEAGAHVTIPLFHAKTGTRQGHFVPQLICGETVRAHLCRVTREVYGFYHDYASATVFGGNLGTLTGIAGGAPKGNISGGAGIFSAQGTDIRSLTVE